MNKKILIFIVGCISTSTVLSTYAAPDLASQMQYQERVNRSAHLASIRQSNQQRLLAVESRRAALEQVGVSASPTQAVTTSASAITSPPAIAEEAVFSAAPSTPQRVSLSDDAAIPGVDMDRVRDTWTSWVNDARDNNGLDPYQIDTRLNTTATEWSQSAVTRGYITHGRSGDGCARWDYSCYKYNSIQAWFRDRGVNPPIINRSNFTENIGYGSYKCGGSDCTDALIRSIRSTFDFFMSEKKYNGPHYRTIMNPNFSRVGLGIMIDRSKGVYYLTAHYTTPLR